MLIHGLAGHQPNGAAPLSPTSKGIQKPYMVRVREDQFAEFPEPRALATHEIPPIVEQFKVAAKNAMAAGNWINWFIVVLIVHEVLSTSPHVSQVYTEFPKVSMLITYTGNMFFMEGRCV